MSSSNRNESAKSYSPQDISKEIVVSQGTPFETNKFLLNNSEFQIDPQVATHMGLFAARSKEEKRLFDAEVLKFVQAIKDDAYSEAYEQGRAEGIKVAKEEALAQAKEEIHARLVALTQTVTSLDKYRERMYEQNEEEIIRFCYLLAEKILLKEVQHNKEYILSIIKKMVPEEQSCIVYLCSTDLEFVQTHLELLDKDIDLKNIRLEKDENLKDGDVILETPNGTLDGTLHTRLEKLKVALEQLE